MEQIEFVELLKGQDFAALRTELKQRPDWVRRELLAEYCPEKLGKGRGGNRPLALACFFGQPTVIDLLLAAGADPEHRNDESRTAYHVALEHNVNAVKHLVRIQMKRDAVACACLRDLDGLRAQLVADRALADDDSTGLSLLGWATYYGARESIELLFEFGAKPLNGELHCAAGIGNTELGELLIEHGADVHQKVWDSDWTPLHVAAAHLYTNNALPFVELLLREGADRRAASGTRGLTPLDIARVGRQRQMDAGIERGDPRYKNFQGVISHLEFV